MAITRREFVTEASLAVLAAAALPALPAFAQTPSTEELLRPGPLPEQVLGKADAPVTIIEYASMTCGHCASFHKTTYPELKKRYIDTGKVRFIFREFPLDPLAAGAFMLARCAGEGKYFPMVEMLFDHQDQWAVRQPLPPLLALAKQAGFTEQSFNSCLQDDKLLKQVEAVRDRGAKEFGVNSTPTFFINGKIEKGALTIQQLESKIEPLLKS
ncbi:MAG: disulfide bond formation protein DsbA [Bradyrhizobiaceae bacterium]|nr:MAG: disulfide bond formation protein DsbA [Bradyrhizobiaceae bacterium]